MIVDMRAPGVEVRPLRQMTGSSEFNEVFLDDVRVPRENLVGEEGKGWEIAQTTLAHERGPAPRQLVIHRMLLEDLTRLVRASSDAALRQMLIEEARKQGKTFGLLFEDISGGFTFTDRSNPQAFQVTPIMVYRVYVDGRADELGEQFGDGPRHQHRPARHRQRPEPVHQPGGHVGDQRDGHARRGLGQAHPEHPADQVLVIAAAAREVDRTPEHEGEQGRRRDQAEAALKPGVIAKTSAPTE